MKPTCAVPATTTVVTFWHGLAAVAGPQYNEVNGKFCDTSRQYGSPASSSVNSIGPLVPGAGTVKSVCVAPGPTSTKPREFATSPYAYQVPIVVERRPSPSAANAGLLRAVNPVASARAAAAAVVRLRIDFTTGSMG